jgi:hypothetical protein
MDDSAESVPKRFQTQLPPGDMQVLENDDYPWYYHGDLSDHAYPNHLPGAGRMDSEQGDTECKLKTGVFEEGGVMRKYSLF